MTYLCGDQELAHVWNPLASQHNGMIAITRRHCRFEQLQNHWRLLMIGKCFFYTTVFCFKYTVLMILFYISCPHMPPMEPQLLGRSQLLSNNLDHNVPSGQIATSWYINPVSLWFLQITSNTELVLICIHWVYKFSHHHQGLRAPPHRDNSWFGKPTVRIAWSIQGS